MSINFNCKMKSGKKTEEWSGAISNITNFGRHYELKIESRSGFIVTIGKSNCGNFDCIPDYNDGCHLSNLNDILWNSEKLRSIMNKVDAVTVAYALQAVANYIDLK